MLKAMVDAVIIPRQVRIADVVRADTFLGENAVVACVATKSTAGGFVGAVAYFLCPYLGRYYMKPPCCLVGVTLCASGGYSSI